MHISNIRQNISKLTFLSLCTKLHLKLHPFDHTQTMDALYKIHLKVIQVNINQLSQWLLKGKHSPPVSVCPGNLIIPLIMQISTDQSRRIVNTVFQDVCQNFNDTLRELNDLQIQQTQLRGMIIRARDDMQEFITDYPMMQTTNFMLKKCLVYL